MARDPIGFQSGDINIYIYEHNSPIALTDPSGLVAQRQGWWWNNPQVIAAIQQAWEDSQP